MGQIFGSKNVTSVMNSSVLYTVFSKVKCSVYAKYSVTYSVVLLLFSTYVLNSVCALQGSTLQCAHAEA